MSTTEKSIVSFKSDDIEAALQSFARGEFIVVVDDEERENEGDLICAASLCTTEKMAWLIKHSSGYVCISLPGSRLKQLEIPMMVKNNQDRHRTAYAVTVDYKQGTTTGISAHDRALTARKLAHYPLSSHQNGTHGESVPNGVASPPGPDSFSRPGHLVPLRARSGGVLKRKGHTEAALDLCVLTSLPPAGILCELVNDDIEGSMARRDDCRVFADRWGLKMITINQLVQYRQESPTYNSDFTSLTEDIGGSE